MKALVSHQRCSGFLERVISPTYEYHLCPSLARCKWVPGKDGVILIAGLAKKQY